MDTPDAERIKHRQIPFSELHQDPNQAQTASMFLVDLEGVLHTEPISPVMLHICYDLAETSLEEIESALTEIGLHLNNRLLFRMKRALYYYTEETFIANCGCTHGQSNCTRKIFAKRYEKLDHSCRDHRPEHWRRYL